MCVSGDSIAESNFLRSSLRCAVRYGLKYSKGRNAYIRDFMVFSTNASRFVPQVTLEKRLYMFYMRDDSPESMSQFTFRFPVGFPDPSTISPYRAFTISLRAVQYCVSVLADASYISTTP